MGAIVLFGAEKGGVGKSMLACNLAVWAATRGASVVLLDADSQATSSSWATRRGDNLLGRDPTPTPIACVQRTGKGVRDTALDQSRSHDLVVIDAGGRDSVELRYALTVAHLAFIPFLPAQADVETAGKVAGIIEGAQALNPALQARAILSRVSAVARRHGELQAALEALREARDTLPVARAQISERKAYRDAFVAGLGVLELESGRSKAAAEIKSLGREIEKILKQEGK